MTTRSRIGRSSALLRRGGAVTATLVVLGAGLVACATSVDPATLSDAAVLATATAAPCGCLLYGSHPQQGTPTATVTGTPPTAMPTATPTRPPRDCDYCTLVPKPSRTPLNWPTPLITCTAGPDQPTSTAVPTEESPLFPTLVPATALPAVLGILEPAAVGSLEGEAQPGSVTLDPRTGRPWLIWAQTNPEPGQVSAGRVYLRRQTTDGDWTAPRSVNGPGDYQGTESAAAVTPDGTVLVAYIRQQSDTAFVEWRVSHDEGTTWSAPADLPDSGVGSVYNLRLVAAADGVIHLAAIAKTGGGDDSTGGDLLYYTYSAGGWTGTRRPVDRGGRQYNVALTSFAPVAGTIRTVLLWNEDHRSYTAYQDTEGAWSRPALLSGGLPTIADYLPGGLDHSMQVLAFTYQDQPWLWAGYSGYSTGYLASFWSPDGGATWSAESELAYNPIGSAGDGDLHRTVHLPIPYWDALHTELLVAYQVCVAGAAGDRSTCFPAFTYGAPGAVGAALTGCTEHPGPAWRGCEDTTHPPLRLFAGTQAGDAHTLRGAGGNGAPAVLLWTEQTGSKELYLAGIALDTLLAGQEVP
ncbi:MAG: glycoside hydrolase [Chloroflexota bacterium]|nr:glycoside hydrolase [Chloroflexota bacterium]